MDIPSFVHKVIVVGILFLFVMCTIVSGIKVTSIAGEDDLVTMTIQTCSLSRDSSQTIRVSKQHAHELQTVFDNLKNQLSTVESSEETQRIFNDTIIELNRYNLLPQGMSVEHAQRLVNRASTYKKMVPSLKKLSKNIQAETTAGAIQNSFCSIAGNTSNIHCAKLAKRTALRLYYIIDFNTGNAPLVKLATGLYVVFKEIAKINQLILRQNGYHVGVCIYFGNYHYAPYPDWLSPAQGWISTNGVNGKQNINGSFWGQTMTGGWQPQVDWYMNYTWRGCLGFTGLIIYTGPDTAYYLGSAFSIIVGPNRP